MADSNQKTTAVLYAYKLFPHPDLSVQYPAAKRPGRAGAGYQQGLYIAGAEE